MSLSCELRTWHHIPQGDFYQSPTMSRTAAMTSAGSIRMV